MEIQIDYPFRFHQLGHTQLTGYDEHVRDMIEQFLLTSPGERVNRPDFGSGLLQRVFEPNSPELAAVLQFNIQSGLQRWLGDVVDLHSLEVTSQDSTLQVLVVYTVKRTGNRQEQTIERSVAA
jgi:uncharacterized protein